LGAWSEEDFAHQPNGYQKGTMSGVERVEHGDTHGTGSVLHTLAQSRAQFSGQRLITTEIRHTQAPGQERYGIRSPIRQRQALREEMLPDCIGVQKAAGSRQIPPLG